jgi:membrane fusion protein, epimerase transport system
MMLNKPATAPGSQASAAQQDWKDITSRIRLGIVCLALLVGGVCLWAWTAPLSGAVIADAVVKSEGNRKTVLHQEGGIVKSVLVKDGDRVTEGQELIRLEDVRVAAGNDQLRAQLDGERARESRLLAERSLARNIKFPEELARQVREPRTSELLGRETALFTARKDTLNKQVALLQQQMGETEKEISFYGSQIESAEKALAAMKEELRVASALLNQGFIQKTRILNLERDVNQQTAAVENARAERAKALQRLSDLKLKVVTTTQNYIQAASDELKDSTTRRVDLEERLRPLADAQTRQKVVAPVAGTVVDLKVYTVGSPIGPREPILDIVPHDTGLVIEARVRVDEANDVSLGGMADVRLSAFKQRMTPLVQGEVTYIAPDRQIDKQTGIPFFTVHVKVSAATLAAAGNLKISPGMPAEVFVRTRSRSAFDYMLEPLADGMRRGMRER